MSQPGVIEPLPTRHRAPFATLAAVAGISPTALNIFVPSMPGLQTAFATNYGTVQLVLTCSLVAFAVMLLASGPLSDSFGRRPVLLAGLVLFLVGTVVCLVAPSMEVLIGGRILQAVGGCAGLSLSRAIVRDVYDRDRAASMLGYGLSLPNSLAGAISIDPRRAGAASGACGFMQMGVGGLASLLVGILLSDSAMPLIAVMITASALAFAAHCLGTGHLVPKGRRQ